MTHHRHNEIEAVHLRAIEARRNRPPFSIRAAIARALSNLRRRA